MKLIPIFKSIMYSSEIEVFYESPWRKKICMSEKNIEVYDLLWRKLKGKAPGPKLQNWHCMKRHMIRGTSPIAKRKVCSFFSQNFWEKSQRVYDTRGRNLLGFSGKLSNLGPGDLHAARTPCERAPTRKKWRTCLDHHWGGGLSS